MKLTINGEAREVAGDSLMVMDILKDQGVESPDMVAVQVNGTFVPRPRYDDFALAENDAVEFLYFMGGGAA